MTEFIMAIRFIPEHLPQIREMLNDNDVREAHRHMEDENRHNYDYFIVWYSLDGSISHGYMSARYMARNYDFPLNYDDTRWFMIREKGCGW